MPEQKAVYFILNKLIKRFPKHENEIETIKPLFSEVLENAIKNNIEKIEVDLTLISLLSLNIYDIFCPD